MGGNKTDKKKKIAKEDKRPILDDGLNKWWFVSSDGCGITCMVITIGLHIFSYWAQWKYIYVPWIGVYSWQNAVYTFFTVLAVYSHTKCQFTAPGAVPKNCKAPKLVEGIDEGNEDIRKYLYLRRKYVSKRLMIKPATGHYCSEIEMVVIKMDHYCPWVNNVVGLFTQKYFLLFVFYTCLCTLWVAIMLGARVYKCTYGNQPRKFSGWDKPQNVQVAVCEVSQWDMITCAANAVESLIFCIFTIAMGCDQYEAIGENTPYIDRLQKKKGKEQHIYLTTCEVFGEDFSWRWFFPFAPTKQLKDQFQQMCYDTLDILNQADKAVKVLVKENQRKEKA